MSYYNYTSHFFKKTVYQNTYDGIVCPLGSQADWDLPDFIKEQVVLPPNTEKASAGRPKKKRILSAGEFKKKNQVKCGRCKQVGIIRKLAEI